MDGDCLTHLPSNKQRKGMEQMRELLTRNWGMLVLRGVIALLFGFLTFIWPGITLAALVTLFGAYALLDGIFAWVVALRDLKAPRVWVLFLEGITGILTAIITFIWPGITALALLYIIAFWASVTGVFEILAAIRLREEISNEWLLGLSGVLSVLFALFLLLFPGAGALTVIWMIGAYAIAFGVLLLGLAFQVRNRGQYIQQPTVL